MQLSHSLCKEKLTNTALLGLCTERAENEVGLPWIAEGIVRRPESLHTARKRLPVNLKVSIVPKASARACTAQTDSAVRPNASACDAYTIRCPSSLTESAG